MKRKKYNNSSRRSAILRYPILTLFLIATATTIIVMTLYSIKSNQPEDFTSSDSRDGSSSQTQSKKSTKVKKHSADSDKDDSVPMSKTPIQNEGPDPNQSEHITGFITSANVSSSHLVIRMTIDQYLSNAGNCTLSISNNTSTKTYFAPTFNNPSSSTCQGFDIPLSELSRGKWNLKITVDADGKTGIISGEANIP